MSFLEDFGDLLPDTVTLRSFTGRDHYGKPTYGAPVEVPGRFVTKTKIARGDDGSEVISSSLVTIPFVEGFTVEGQCSVNGVEKKILMVEGAPDEANELYYMRIKFE